MSEHLAVENKRGLSPAALLVAGAFFMEFIDGTVIATALPDMAKSFAVQAVDLNIGISLSDYPRGADSRQRLDCGSLRRPKGVYPGAGDIYSRLGFMRFVRKP